MDLFGTIVDSIFGHAAPAPPPPSLFSILFKWIVRLAIGFGLSIVILIVSWFMVKRWLFGQVNRVIRPEYRDLVGRVREWFQVEQHTSANPRDRARQAAEERASNGGSRTTLGSTGSFQSTDTGCPICLSDTAVLPVQTNCGHTFCGNCIVTYWHRGQWGADAVKCPVCRQRITLLMRSTTAGSAMPENLDQVSQVEGEIQSYNRKFSGAPRSWLETVQDIPGLLNHLFGNASLFGIIRLLSQGRLMFYVLAFLAYFVMPFDIIPESILGIFGYFDDLAALGLVLSQVAAVYRAVVVRRQGDEYE